jgi:hypothetical protein
MEYKKIEFSHSGQYIILQADSVVEVLEVSWGPKGPLGSNEVFGVSVSNKVDFGDKVRACQLSHDDRYWAAQFNSNLTTIYILDFSGIINGVRGDTSGFRNFPLKHDEPVTMFSMRKSKNLTRSGRIPNIIASFERSGIIKIWCENSLKDNFTFFLAYTHRTELDLGCNLGFHRSGLTTNQLSSEVPFQR